MISHQQMLATITLRVPLRSSLTVFNAHHSGHCYRQITGKEHHKTKTARTQKKRIDLLKRGHGTTALRKMNHFLHRLEEVCYAELSPCTQCLTDFFFLVNAFFPLTAWFWETQTAFFNRHMGVPRSPSCLRPRGLKYHAFVLLRIRPAQNWQTHVARKPGAIIATASQYMGAHCSRDLNMKGKIRLSRIQYLPAYTCYSC